MRAFKVRHIAAVVVLFATTAQAQVTPLPRPSGGGASAVAVDHLRSVLVIGDSISADGSSGTQGAWRVEFVTKLRAAGYVNTVTVGTQQSNFLAPTAAQKAAAYAMAISGLRIANILHQAPWLPSNPILATGWDVAGLQIGGAECDTNLSAPPCPVGGYDVSSSGHIDVFVPMLAPDLVIVFLGTNDIFNAIAVPNGDPTVAHVRMLGFVQRLITFLRPGVPILISTLYQWASAPGVPLTVGTIETNRLNFNSQLAAAVIPALGAQVSECDIQTNWSAATDLQNDNLHPNPSGMAVLGDNFAVCVLARARALGLQP